MFGFRDSEGNDSGLHVAAAPLAVAIFGVILLALPLRLFEAAAPTPLIPLLAVYHWAARDPDLFPAPAVLGVGLLQDLLLSAPFGLFACAYLATRWIVLSQDDFLHGRDRTTLWGGMALVGFAAGLILWLAACARAGGFVSAAPVVTQIGLTVLLYPWASMVFDRLEGRLEGEVR